MHLKKKHDFLNKNVMGVCSLLKRPNYGICSVHAISFTS